MDVQFGTLQSLAHRAHIEWYCEGTGGYRSRARLVETRNSTQTAHFQCVSASPSTTSTWIAAPFGQVAAAMGKWHE